MALRRPPKQTEPISIVHADGVFTGHKGMNTSNAGRDTFGGCWY